MEGRNLTQEPLQITSKNILGWISLALRIYDLKDEDRKRIESFLKRRDIARRQKEIDEYWR
jgi:hypothetical protein